MVESPICLHATWKKIARADKRVDFPYNELGQFDFSSWYRDTKENKSFAPNDALGLGLLAHGQSVMLGPTRLNFGSAPRRVPTRRLGYAPQRSASRPTATATRPSRPGVIRDNPQNRLIETGTPLKSGKGWRKRWFQMTEKDQRSYGQACGDELHRLNQQTKHLPDAEARAARKEAMGRFREAWLKDFLEIRPY